jgi:hypothetical protein
MERRGFLKMIGFAPTLALPIGEKSEEARYHEWSVTWSGWIPMVNQHLLVGRWVALKHDDPIGVYSSVPGGCGWFLPGQMFDVSIYEKNGQMYITPEITMQAAEKQKNLGLMRLLKFLDNPDPLPEYWRR